MTAKLDICIQQASRTITVRGQALAMSAPWAQLKALLERLIAPPDVCSVEIDRHRGQAILNLLPDPEAAADGSSTKIVRRIAHELRQTSTVTKICDAYSRHSVVRFSKLASNVVGGSVCSQAPGRTRFQHPLLRGAPGRDAIVGPLLARMNGVNRVLISPTTGTVLVLHSVNISAAQILLALEQILARAGSVNGDGVGSTQLMLSGGCVGLAVLAETVSPWLIPVTAGTLVACNLPTLGRGLRELATLRWRLPALYTVIMGTTLASGQVLAAAIMQASIAGWYWWSNRRLRSMIADLLSSDSVARLADRVNSACDSPPAASLGRNVANRIDMLEKSDSHSDVLDRHDATRRADIASSAVGPGSTYESAITSLARTALGSQPTDRVHDGAAQFVPFAFATGATALLTYDITTLAAVLRPDYATGPSISERLSMVAGVRQLLVHGWMVVRPDALLHLTAVDTVVVLSTQRQPTGDLAVDSAAIPASAVPVFVAERQKWKLQDSQASLNVVCVSGDSSACASYIRQLAKGGSKLAVCGPTEILTLLNPQDAIRIACNVDEFGRTSVGDIVALPGRHDLVDLLDVLAHQNRCTGGVWPVVLTCNMASVLGAFLVGLTSLHVVILTNLGTWMAYTLFANEVDRIQKKSPASNSVTNATSTSTKDGEIQVQRQKSDIRANRKTVKPAPSRIERLLATRNFS